MSLSRAELEVHARDVLTVESMGGGIVRARVLGFDLFLDQENEKSLSPHILSITPGVWEASTTRAIENYVRPGMVAVDAGANIGYFTLLLAARLRCSRVVAVEPLDSVRSLLARSVQHNELVQVVQVDQRALWDSSGTELTLNVPGLMEGSSTITGPPFGVPEFTRSQRVMTVTLDDLLEEIGIDRVDFVKVDIEGSEARFWRGMRRTWARNPELVVCAEMFTAPEGPEFLDVLRTDGACVQRIDDEGDIAEFPEQGLAPYAMLWISHGQHQTV